MTDRELAIQAERALSEADRMRIEYKIARLEHVLGTLIAWLHHAGLSSKECKALLAMLNEPASAMPGITATPPGSHVA